jgi:tRNA 2-thiouridine synthesizing protein B
VLLHTVNKSPFASTALDSCLRAALPGAAILLMEDAVYAARAGSAASEKLGSLTGIRCFALQADVKARGLLNSLAEHIELASFDDFVRLSTECHAVQSWY